MRFKYEGPLPAIIGIPLLAFIGLLALAWIFVFPVIGLFWSIGWLK